MKIIKEYRQKFKGHVLNELRVSFKELSDPLPEGKTSSKDFGGFKNFVFKSVTKYVPLNKIES